MLNAFVKSVAVSAVVAFSAMTLPAAAAPVSLTYGGGTAGGTATITASPVMPVGGFRTYGAWGFNMTDSTPGGLGSFVAWCLDISQWLGGANVPYNTTTTPFSNSYGLNPTEMARVQAVFDANYASVTLNDNTQAAGFQVALWTALYDTDWDATQGLGEVFAVSAGGVQTQANIYLVAASLDSSATRLWNLTYLESTGSPIRQNLVTATPVPLPAAAGLLLVALGGLGLLRRRRRAV